MTTLWVKPTAITCDQCATEYLFPRDQECPECGEPLLVRARPGLAVDRSFLDRAQDEPEEEVDSTAKTILLVGIAFCATIMALALWGEDLLRPLADSISLPPQIYRVLRLAFLLIGAFGFLRGCVSLLGWKSGHYWYRRLRRF